MWNRGFRCAVLGFMLTAVTWVVFSTAYTWQHRRAAGAWRIGIPPEDPLLLSPYVYRLRYGMDLAAEPIDERRVASRSLRLPGGLRVWSLTFDEPLPLVLALAAVGATGLSVWIGRWAGRRWAPSFPFRLYDASALPAGALRRSERHVDVVVAILLVGCVAPGSLALWYVRLSGDVARRHAAVSDFTPSWSDWALIAVGAGVVTTAICLLGARRSFRRLPEGIARRAGLCRRCGYPMFALRGTLCPECGGAMTTLGANSDAARRGRLARGCVLITLIALTGTGVRRWLSANEWSPFRPGINWPDATGNVAYDDDIRWTYGRTIRLEWADSAGMLVTVLARQRGAPPGRSTTGLAFMHSATPDDPSSWTVELMVRDLVVRVQDTDPQWGFGTKLDFGPGRSMIKRIEAERLWRGTIVSPRGDAGYVEGKVLAFNEYGPGEVEPAVAAKARLDLEGHLRSRGFEIIDTEGVGADGGGD